jgi:hypothetical protein
MCQVSDQDQVFDGTERVAVAASWFESLVLRGEVAVLATDRGKGGLFERDPKPLAAFAGAPRAAFAGGLVVAGAASGPRGEVPGRGEDAHVGADLSDHHLSPVRAATPGWPA